jgi:hypothetical protein
MPHLACAVGLLVSSVAADCTWLVSRNSAAIARASQSLQQLRIHAVRAAQQFQVASVDLVLVGLTDDAMEDLRVAAPPRWQAKPGQCALTPAENEAIRTRLHQIASAGHAKALGRFEIILRHGEQLGLATHRAVRLVGQSPAGTGGVTDFLASTIPTLQLQQLDLFSQQLRMDVRLSMCPMKGGPDVVNSTTRIDRFLARDGETLMVLVKSPYPVDWHANEKDGPPDLALELGHRLLLMTTERRARPERNGAIVVDRGVPRLGK